MVTAREVLGAMDAMRRDRRKVERFRCGHLAYRAVLTMEPPWTTFGFSPSGREVTVVGLAVVLDEWLPETVWRLTDGADTLLYDCRELMTMAHPDPCECGCERGQVA